MLDAVTNSCGVRIGALMPLFAAGCWGPPGAAVGPERSVNSAKAEGYDWSPGLQTAITHLLETRETDVTWESTYVAGVYPAAMSVLGTAFFEVDDPANVREEAELVEWLIGQQTDGGFAPYPGAAPLAGTTRNVLLALRVFRDKRGTYLESHPALVSRIEESLAQGEEFVAATSEDDEYWAYGMFAGLFSSAVYPDHDGEVSFVKAVAAPFAVEMAQLAKSYLTFLNTAFSDSLPAVGVLYEAGGRETLGSQLLRRFALQFNWDLSNDGLKESERQIISSQEANGSWIYVPRVTVMNLLALAKIDPSRYRRSHPVIDRGLNFLREQRHRSREGELVVSWIRGDLWDSAVATWVISRYAPDAIDARRAIDYFIREQDEETARWAFSSQAKTSDNDSTALALIALAKLHTTEPDYRPAAVRHAIGRTVWRLATLEQQADGGWGSYTRGSEGQPWYGIGSEPMLQVDSWAFDPSTADLSARVVLALTTVLGMGLLTGSYEEAARAALERSMRYFRNSQAESGGWWSRWTAGYLVTPGFLVPALRRGQDLGIPGWIEMNDPSIEKLREFLIASQDPEDGGWGSPVEVDTDIRLAASGPSSSLQTALTLIALVASMPIDSIKEDEAVRRGAEYLYQALREDRIADERPLYTNGPAFEYYSNAHLTHALATWALGYYESALAKGVKRATAP